jgi:hypothetical protein
MGAPRQRTHFVPRIVMVQTEWVDRLWLMEGGEGGRTGRLSASAGNAIAVISRGDALDYGYRERLDFVFPFVVSMFIDFVSQFDYEPHIQFL